MVNVLQTLAKRAGTHGDYRKQAGHVQQVKELMRQTPNWDSLPSYMKESLDMIAVKMSRVLHGDPLELDHWRDIAGYANLPLIHIEQGDAQ